VGDQFEPVATGREGLPGHGGHEKFTVTGILVPTDTPNDQAIFVNIEGFFLCPAHQQGPSSGEQGAAVVKCPKCGHAFSPQGDHAGHEGESGAKPQTKAGAHEEHDEHCKHGDHEGHEHARRATAVLLCTNDSPKALELADTLNRQSSAQAVYPIKVIADFFDNIIGNVQLLLLVLAVLVVIVAGIGTLVSIYNSMNDRRHDIAVMRALGASRGIVMSVILLESILLALGGGLMGLLLGHGLTGVLSPVIAKELGVTVSALEFKTVELLLVPGLIVLATLVGYLPAAVAYRTDVAKSLQAGA
jgi:putative ABC transport system permease protein